MNYRREIKILKKRRREYFPVMERLLVMHGSPSSNRFPVEITLEGGMLTSLELLDIGYLDPEMFIVKQSFGNYKALYYTGGYPFTPVGVHALHEWKAAGRKKILLLIAIAVIILLTGAAIIIIHASRG